MNKISIIIPLYNKEVYIEETINNVLNQTFQYFELIIINDGSVDKGPSIVESFEDDRIRLINKVNGGVSSARNIGIQHARYDYIAFLDADDMWLSNHLEVINELIDRYRNVSDVFVTNFARKYLNGNLIPNRDYKDLHTGIVDNYFKEALNKPVIHTSCVCISKTALIEVGGFDEKLTNGEDIQLWIKLARKYRVAYSSDLTEYYLQDAMHNSSARIKKAKSYGYYIDVFDSISWHEFLFKLKLKVTFIIKVLLNKYL